MARPGQLSGPPIHLDNAPQAEATVFANVWWASSGDRPDVCWLVGAVLSITVLLSLCGLVPYVRSVVLSHRRKTREEYRWTPRAYFSSR
jgi:hypothetical protein